VPDGSLVGHGDAVHGPKRMLRPTADANKNTPTRYKTTSRLAEEASRSSTRVFGGPASLGSPGNLSDVCI
jgi:hypothetical protein